MKNLCTLLTFILLFSMPALAQRTIKPVPKATSTTHKQDTMPSLLFQKYFGSDQPVYDDWMYVNNVRYNPDYYRLFTPLTYYYSPIENLSELGWELPYPDLIPDMGEGLLPIDTVMFTKKERIHKRVDRVLIETYVKYPELVKMNEGQIMSRELFHDALPPKEATKTSIIDLFKPDKPIENVGEAEMEIRKPNFWTTGGNGSLQMSQNSISDNWYQGGESTNNLLANVQLFANYNDKEKLQFENLLEVKVGFNSVESDTVHKYRVNTDVLRLYSKLGIQAATQWYYTVTGEVKTQFFSNYKTNSNDLVSSFLAPANLTLSIGMDYKLKKEKFNLSVVMSPLAYNFRYVGDSRVDETSFGLDPGKKVLHDFGSQVQVTLSWKIISSITYDTRLFYFTNYKKVQAEWENTINFVLNRYLSTKLFVHTRFDDGVSREPGKSFFQFKEFLSFGINYKW